MGQLGPGYCILHGLIRKEIKAQHTTNANLLDYTFKTGFDFSY